MHPIPSTPTSSTILPNLTLPPSLPPPAAVLKDIRFSYDRGTSWALDGVSLTVHAGERLCLVGPNGSGKSTLARLIAGLTAPDGGEVTLLGQRVYAAGPNADAYRAARHGIGMVFQNPEDQLVTTVLEDDVAFWPGESRAGARAHRRAYR